MSPTKSPADFTVLELKEKLKTLGLSSSGSKNELINRMIEADPEGNWLRESGDGQNDQLHNEEQDETETSSVSEAEMARREVEMLRRERELMERELALMRREAELLRERGRERETERFGEQLRAHQAMDPTEMLGTTARVGITAIAELLAHFDGASDSWEVWERQVRLLATTYGLRDEMTKILIGSRLKGRAAEWFRSKPEYIEMSTDDLLQKMKDMFDHRPNRLVRRREFEGRVWKRGEAFGTYMHDKIILANRVPIEESDLVDYIIDGITDLNLQNQARIHEFRTTASLLRAFEKVTFQPKGQKDGTVAPAVQSGGSERSRGGLRQRGGDEGEQRPRQCFGCGDRNHVIANCPTREGGVKCYRCGERGHVAARCTGKASAKDSCAVSEICDKKYYKDVSINDYQVQAMIDTGSDMCLMRADCYGKLNVPLKRNKIYFRGIGSDRNETLGEFDADVRIDDNVYSMRIRVVSDGLMRYDLIIGVDFLRTIEIVMKNGEISIVKSSPAPESPKLPEVFQIECAHEANELDVAHLDGNHRNTLENLIRNYVPNKTRDVDVKMRLILKDDEPVYQRARRCSEREKQIIKEQISDWTRDGVVRPSLSEYASPVVLVKKKAARIDCALIFGS